MVALGGVRYYITHNAVEGIETRTSLPGSPERGPTAFLVTSLRKTDGWLQRFGLSWHSTISYLAFK